MLVDPLPIPSDAALAEVRRHFAERHAAAVAPSLVYGVIAGGTLVDSFGFGDMDGHGTVPTADTAYRIASMTKSFTAAALLLLRDQGALSLDAPITDFVPAFADVRLPTNDSPVPTLRMLATMSAGLPGDDPWADRQEALTDDELDAVLRAGVRFVFVPGTEFEYSNLGYALLGRAIQVAAGRRYHDVVMDEIIRPLGLASTRFTADVAAPDVPAADVPAVGGVTVGGVTVGGVAVGFDHVDDAWASMPFSGPGAFSPIGGLFSTVTDIAAWAQFFLDAHRGTTTGPLSPASRREMQQAQRLVPPTNAMSDGLSVGYGLGLVLTHDPEHGPIISHSGGYPGFSSHMRWHPATGIGIVALENATYAGVGRPAAEALRAILATVETRPAVRAWPEAVAAQATVSALLQSWDDALAADLFSENIELDEPIERRRAAIGRALEQTGALGANLDGNSDFANDRTWSISGEHADLRCELTLSPLVPPRVQTLEVTVQAHAPEQHQQVAEQPEADAPG
ncbi:MAG: serine hydrolase domain-containing protein [Ilumatobacteraceae bacterium]